MYSWLVGNLDSTARSSEFRPVFAGNLIDLLSSELLWRYAWRIAGLTEKAVQAGRRRYPEQKQFVIGISKPMPRVFGYEYCSPLLKWVPYIVQYEDSAAFQNVEGFVHLEMSVDRNACADRYLLGAQGQIVRA